MLSVSFVGSTSGIWVRARVEGLHEDYAVLRWSSVVSGLFAPLRASSHRRIVTTKADTDGVYGLTYEELVPLPFDVPKVTGFLGHEKKNNVNGVEFRARVAAAGMWVCLRGRLSCASATQLKP